MNKVWVYTISKSLTDQQLQKMAELGHDFVTGWTAHEKALTASFEIFKKRLIIVKVNEEEHSASGCSIDKLLKFIKVLEGSFQVSLLDRLLVAFEKNGQVNIARSSQIPALLSSGEVERNTPVYNTSISTSSELENWLQPLDQTWLKKYLEKV